MLQLCATFLPDINFGASLTHASILPCRKALRSKVSAAGGSKSLLLKSGGVMVIVLAAYVALRRRQAPTGRRGHSIL